MIEVNYKLLTEAAKPPAGQVDGDAGLDLSAVSQEIIQPGDYASIGTGVAIELPRGMMGLVLPRSGLALKFGISLVNSPGLIDSGYRGEIRVLLMNNGKKPFAISPGDRIAQLVILGHAEVLLKEVSELGASERGDGGFGHTGR